MSLEEDLKNNKGLLTAVLSVLIGLIVIMSIFTIYTMVEDKAPSYISSSAPQVIINTEKEEKTITKDLPQSLKEQKYTTSTGLTINNNINVQTSSGSSYYPYPRKMYYNYPHYNYKHSYYPYYYKQPKHYFYSSNSYGNYNKYYYY